MRNCSPKHGATWRSVMTKHVMDKRSDVGKSRVIQAIIEDKFALLRRFGSLS